MRISDWSSDVCSSDLVAARHLIARLAIFDRNAQFEYLSGGLGTFARRGGRSDGEHRQAEQGKRLQVHRVSHTGGKIVMPGKRRSAAAAARRARRGASGRGHRAAPSSEEGRGGEECGRTSRSWWPPYP